MSLFTQSIHDSGWPAYRLGTEGFYSVWSQAMLEKVAAEGLNHVTRWEVYQCQGNIPKETYSGPRFLDSPRRRLTKAPRMCRRAQKGGLL